jgi:hypothetical protein
LRVPVIQRCTDINLRDCFVVWCSCDFESPAYLDFDVASAVAWQHAFGNQVSDMRAVKPSSNGNGSRASGRR